MLRANLYPTTTPLNLLSDAEVRKKKDKSKPREKIVCNTLIYRQLKYMKRVRKLAPKPLDPTSLLGGGTK
jgi:hypothetical protein